MLGPGKIPQDQPAVLVVQHHQTMSPRTLIFRVRVQNNSVQRFLRIYTTESRETSVTMPLLAVICFTKYLNPRFFYYLRGISDDITERKKMYILCFYITASTPPLSDVTGMV